MKIYVAVRETGDFLEEVNTIEEGLKVIEQYEKDDKKEGVYDDSYFGYYNLVDEDRCSIEY